jgi:hypothetical protein
MQPAGDQKSSNTIRTAALFLILASIFLTYYAILHTGTLRVDDEHILISRAVSLHLQGDLADHQVYGNQRVRDLAELGDAATEVEPGQAVLAQPYLWLASLFNTGYSQVVSSMTMMLTAATALVTAASVLQLGFSKRTAVWIAVLFGTATTAAVYADTFFRDTQAMFFSALFFYAMLLWLRAGKQAGVPLMLVSLLGAVLTKNNMLALLPALAAGLALSYPGLKAGGQWAGIRRGMLLGGFLILLGATIVLFMPDGGPLARFNRSYYLFLLEFFSDSLTPSFLVNLAGPFISPAKSIFIFSPPLLLALAGLRRSWRTDRGYTSAVLIFTASLAAAQALFFRDEWAGFFGWGLRFMLPAVPVLLTLAAALVEECLKNVDWRKYVPVAFLTSGMVINIAGSAVNWRLPYRIWMADGLDPYQTVTAWQWRYLAVGQQIKGLVDPAEWSLSWLRVFSQGTAAGVIVPAAGAVLLIGLGYLMRQLLSERRLRYRDAILLGLLTAVGWLFPFFPGLWAAQADPYWCAQDTAYQQALMYVENEVRDGDVLVFDSYGTEHWRCWLNDWDRPQPWYSLAYKIPGPSDPSDDSALADPSVELLKTLSGAHTRLWYVSTDQAPDYTTSGARTWLEEQHPVLLSETFFEGGEEISILVFRLAKGE